MREVRKSGGMAEVSIDYKNKTININQVHTKGTEFRRLSYLFSYYSFYSLVKPRLFLSVTYCYFVVFFLVNCNLILDFPNEIMGFFFSSLFLFALFVGFGLTLQHTFNPRSDIFFAKMNAWFGKKTKLIINNIHKKEILLYIPKFQNIFLEYKTKGDYDDYLKKIKILKLNNDLRIANENKYWGILFNFSKTPKSGELYLRYY